MNLLKTIPLHKAWLNEEDCRNCAVRRMALFSALETTDLSHFNQPIEHIALEPQTLLYRAGEHRRVLFTLREGVIKLVQYLPDGNQRIIRLLGASDTLGLEALLKQSYQHDAVTLTYSEVCVIPVAVVEHLSREHPRLCKELMQRWQRALTQADKWLIQFTTGSARQRVARLLLSLAGSESQGPFHLFGREDMGAMVGLSTETVSRVIAALRRQKILTELRPNLLECDNAALQRIADSE